MQLSASTLKPRALMPFPGLINAVPSVSPHQQTTKSRALLKFSLQKEKEDNTNLQRSPQVSPSSVMNQLLRW
jgi:hypothetical protein